MFMLLILGGAIGADPNVETLRWRKLPSLPDPIGLAGPFAGVSGDEIWYNPGDNRVYFGNQPIFVVDATSYQVIASIDVGDTHSLAANSENNHIFVPVTGVGVVVYADDEDQEGHGRN